MSSTFCQRCADFSNEGIGAYTASKAVSMLLNEGFRKEARELWRESVCDLSRWSGYSFPSRRSPREYLDPEQVVDAILFMASQNGISSVDELVIRPIVEKLLLEERFLYRSK